MNLLDIKMLTLDGKPVEGMATCVNQTEGRYVFLVEQHVFPKTTFNCPFTYHDGKGIKASIGQVASEPSRTFYFEETI